MMEETGLKEVSFMTMSSGRDLENIRLSGMFACSFPIFVKKNDTLASLQEQLVRAARHPVVDMEEADPGFIRNASGYPVTLSMQNYMRAPSARIRELPLFTFPAASSWKRESGHEKPFRKNMGIVVFPDSPFIISILYDGMNHGRAAAESIGRKLLAEMRKMIEEEK
jgi:hypothetical protein